MNCNNVCTVNLLCCTTILFMCRGFVTEYRAQTHETDTQWIYPKINLKHNPLSNISSSIIMYCMHTYLVFHIQVVCRPLEHQWFPTHHHRLYPTLHQGTPPPCPLWTWSPAPGESHPPRSSLELSVRGEYNITTCKECIHVAQHKNLSNYANRCEGSYHYCTEK